METATNNYKAQLSAAEAKHREEIATLTERSKATETEANLAREQAEVRVADLEVLLDDKTEEVQELQTVVEKHEKEKAVKDAQGGTLVECVFKDEGSLGIGAITVPAEWAGQPPGVSTALHV